MFILPACIIIKHIYKVKTIRIYRYQHILSYRFETVGIKYFKVEYHANTIYENPYQNSEKIGCIGQRLMYLIMEKIIPHYADIYQNKMSTRKIVYFLPSWISLIGIQLFSAYHIYIQWLQWQWIF